MAPINRTTHASWYIPPNEEQMAEMAKKVELEQYASDIVTDVTNLSTGGELREPEDYLAEVKRKIVHGKKVQSDADGDYRMPISKKFTKNKSEAVEEHVTEEMKYHRNVTEFLKTLKLDNLPGNSPLEKAMGMLKMLSQQQGGEARDDADGDKELPIFKEGNENQAKELAKKMNRVQGEMNKLEADELDMLDSEGKYHDMETGEITDGLQCAMDVFSPHKAEILKIARSLDNLSKLRQIRQIHPTPDREGDDVRTRNINGIDELGMIQPYELGIRQKNKKIFFHDLVMETIQVQERVVRTDKMQFIFILMDASGSMAGPNHNKATGVVMNRLRAVTNGDAELYLAMYADSMYGKVQSARNPEEAKALMKSFQKLNFDGGGTNTAKAVKQAVSWMENLMKENPRLHKPEIVVLSDGDSSAGNLHLDDLRGFKLHGFSINYKNPQLSRIARSSGGVAVENF